MRNTGKSSHVLKQTMGVGKTTEYQINLTNELFRTTYCLSGWYVNQMIIWK